MVFFHLFYSAVKGGRSFTDSFFDEFFLRFCSAKRLLKKRLERLYSYSLVSSCRNSHQPYLSALPILARFDKGLKHWFVSSGVQRSAIYAKCAYNSCLKSLFHQSHFSLES